MKKFIIMSLTLLAFSLVGCGKKDDKDKKEDCEKQEGKVWNDESKKCEDKEDDSAPTTKADCDKDATKVWNESANDGKGACEDKPAEVAKYTITNKLANSAKVESGTVSLDIAQNACANVTAEQWKALKVSVANVAVCDNSNMKTDDVATTDVDESTQKDDSDDCPAAGNKDLQAKAGSSPAVNELADAASAGANCKDLAAAPAASN